MEVAEKSEPKFFFVRKKKYLWKTAWLGTWTVVTQLLEEQALIIDQKDF